MCPKIFTEFGMLVFLTNLVLRNFRSYIWPYFFFFHSNRPFCMVLVGKSSKEYPVNDEVAQGSILGHKPLCFTLFTFLMMLTVIKHMTSCKNYKWLLNLNLICETLWTQAGSGLLFSMLEKLNWFHLTESYNTGAIDLLMWKWTDLFLRKNYLLKFWGCLNLLN